MGNIPDMIMHRSFNLLIIKTKYSIYLHQPRCNLWPQMHPSSWAVRCRVLIN